MKIDQYEYRERVSMILQDIEKPRKLQIVKAHIQAYRELLERYESNNQREKRNRQNEI